MESSFNQQDLETGHKVIGYALKLLAWGTALAVAWACSSFIMGVIMFIITSLIMLLLTAVVHIGIMFKVEPTTVASLGRTVGGLTGRVSSLFTRKAAA
jgi:hypothetical protein